MNKQDLLKKEDSIIRILDIIKNDILMVDCIKKSVPKWIKKADVESWDKCTLQELLNTSGMALYDIENIDNINKKAIYEKYNLIAAILPFVSDKKERCKIISKISEYKGISKQTINYYLWLYLVYQDISVFAKATKNADKELTTDEKNMRWALNKYFYTKYKNSLNTAYTFMLKEKYCNSVGELLDKHPSFYQFRYFYRKNKNMQTFYISRNGLKNYQRNNRPLLGDNIQEFAPVVGIGMLDSTICDIYLVNEMGSLVGRPILTACIDSYSSLCCGYSLTWEGGVYSLRNLMLNIITDKIKLCKKFGISINTKIWDVNMLPGTFITDKGSEYKSENFEQITELGITIVNLPSYRPELKGAVEKFFDLIQSYFKPYLRGKGVIEQDFQERGSHDYRKDACLTINEFEKVILHCIIYYNSQRILDNFPFTEDMLSSKIKPYANEIWSYGKTSPCLVSAEEIIGNNNSVVYYKNEIECKIAKYVFNIFASNIDINSSINIGDFLHSKLAYSKYVSLRGEQRNISLLFNDFCDYYKELSNVTINEQWQLQKIFNNRRFNMYEICLLSMFLNISEKELIDMKMPKKTQQELFDEKIILLHNQGLKYSEIAKRLNASYDVVKTIGEGKYGYYHYQLKKPEKGGARKKDWNTLDKKYLPLVKDLISKLNGSSDNKPLKITVGTVERLLELPKKSLVNCHECYNEILKHYISQEEYWAKKVVWAVKKIQGENRVVNWKNISDLTHMRKCNMAACIPFLKNYAGEDIIFQLENMV